MEFWENKFNEEQTLWGFDPSDSALITSDYLLQKNLTEILIPGFGYGRNAKIFLDKGFRVTGVEISKTAIQLAREKNGLDCLIHHGSVTDMPYDNKIYDAIFCYALIHLLDANERQTFIKACWNQLKPDGYMIFTMASDKASMYGNGTQLSNDRYELMPGLEVFFYNHDSVSAEFGEYGLIDIQDIDEPIKHMENEPPLKLIMIRCKKTK